MKPLLGLIAGIAAAFALLMSIELVSHQIWPPPAGLDSGDADLVAAAMAQVPLGALLSVALAWVVAAFGGAWVAATVARTAWPAFVAAGLIVIGAVATLVMIPHPIWFWPVALVVAPLAAVYAARLGTGRRPETRPAPATPDLQPR